jgi:replication factor A1
MRRNIMLADESGLKIAVALWGNLANMFDLQVGQVLAVRSARVSDYGGKSLNSGDDHSQIYIDPDHNRTLELQKWHAACGDQGLQSLTAAGGGEGGSRDNHRMVKEMMDTLYKDDQILSGQGQPAYFKLSGYIQRVMYDEQRQSYFIGCPDCKRKVAGEREGFFRCDYCAKSFAEQDVRVTYTLAARFQDSTDSIFL